MSFIPKNRPVIGEDLDALREQLGLSTMDGCWLYGMSMNKWTETVKIRSRDTVENVSLALLARQLSSNPHLCPVPVMPRASEIYQLIKTYHPAVDKKRLAVMFGCEASSGYRWITMGSKISPVLSRLFMVFRLVFLALLKRSDSQGLSMLAEWDQMVLTEARHRGVSDVFSSGRWEANDNKFVGRAVLGQDLDVLREELGLSTMDACWLYGMSMTKWSEVVNKDGRKPVANTSLALLVRALMTYPQACPVPKMTGANDIFDQIKKTKRFNLDETKEISIDKKRFSIMFGCESSAGYRWITRGSKISPVLARLFTIFKYRHAETLTKLRKLPKSSSKVLSGMKKLDSRNDELLLLDDWDEMVNSEARVRGVYKVFNTGRWV